MNIRYPIYEGVYRILTLQGLQRAFLSWKTAKRTFQAVCFPHVLMWHNKKSHKLPLFPCPVGSGPRLCNFAANR